MGLTGGITGRPHGDKALLVALCGVLCVLWSMPHGALAGTASGEEYEVKSALLYNFIRFTEWPAGQTAGPGDVLRIGICGDDATTDAFGGLAGRTLHNRTIEIVRVRRPDDLAWCRAVFVARGERDLWPQLAAAVSGRPVLVVGEMTGFLEAGGMINLHVVDKKIRFEVDLDQTRQEGLNISSRLLKLASRVVAKREVVGR